MTISPDGAAQTSSSLDLTPANERLVLPATDPVLTSDALLCIELILLSMLRSRLNETDNDSFTFINPSGITTNAERLSREVKRLMNAYDILAWSINLGEVECRITWGKRSIPAGFNDLTPGAKRFLCKRLETALGY